MTWEVTWDDEALDDLDRLDRRTRERIIAAVERLAAEDYGNVKRLHGLHADFRLRVGDWRVLFSRDVENRDIMILQVVARGSAYRS
ncbi:MAG: type II toxin-antitoxin system RelE/ParE family toxin [Chloroflexi bacterium]|nr:type II toxin-antitoxin system RelE/ParE family toxin [Chloroflexota bacterium]